MTTKQKRELDKLWGQVIHKQYKKCQVCGKTPINAHHIFSRTRLNTRWNTENGIGLCVGCHTMSNILSAHKAPLSFFQWLENKKGKKWITDLQIASQMIIKGIDYNLIKLQLEQELKNLK